MYDTSEILQIVVIFFCVCVSVCDSRETHVRIMYACQVCRYFNNNHDSTMVKRVRKVVCDRDIIIRDKNKCDVKTTDSPVAPHFLLSSVTFFFVDE